MRRTPITIGSRTVVRDDALAALGQALDALPQYVMQAPPRSAGHLSRPAVRHGAASAMDAGGVSRREPPPGRTTLSREHQGPRAVLNAVERLARGYGVECERTRQDLAIAEAQLRDYQARLGQAVPARCLPGRADRACVTNSRPAFPARLRRQAANRAERCRAGRTDQGTGAANTVEATPERTGRRRTDSRGARHRPHPPQSRISYSHPAWNPMPPNRHRRHPCRAIPATLRFLKCRLTIPARHDAGLHARDGLPGICCEGAVMEALLFPFLRLCWMPRFASAKAGPPVLRYPAS